MTGRTGPHPEAAGPSRAGGPYDRGVLASPTRTRFEDACAEIGADLDDFGFRYLRSKRHAKKVIGGWQQVVSFQSSFRNIADGIRLWIWY